MYAALKNRLYEWLYRRHGEETGVIVLVQRRVYILPTQQGLVFGVAVLVMILGSINYTLGLGFVLAFLLMAVGVNGMVYTFRNLANLKVARGRTQPVFAGDDAQFSVHVENSGAASRYAVGLTQDRKSTTYVDLPARSITVATIGIPAPRRGMLRPGRLTLFTRYPLGLYYAWAYLELDMQCIVYPRPATRALPLPRATASVGAGAEHGSGQEDFAGLRQFHLGDSPRHVAWKAAARDQGLLTKLFSGRADSELWLDWSQLPAQMDVEERLSHLVRWVVDAHNMGLAYGLRLPGETVDMAAGEAQRNRCLETLALYNETQ